jgi:MFS family permease
MALTNLAVFGGAFFTPILVGKITHTIGWEWSFYFEAIFCGVMIPFVIFFVPETAYRRSAHLNTDMASSDDVRLFQKEFGKGHELSEQHGPGSAGTGQEFDADQVHEAKNGNESTAERNSDARLTTQVPGSNTPRITYAQSLLPFSGRKSDENFFKLLLRPFPLMFHPAIFWAMFIQGAMIGWTVFIGIILAAIFLGPPLFWTETETGYAYTGPFVGALLGFVVAGGLADWSAKFMTRRNGGVYEPEFRIILVIPQLVFGVAGLYGFGVTSARVVDFGWFLPVFFFGLEVMGMVIGAVASALYIVDAHRKFLDVQAIVPQSNENR